MQSRYAVSQLCRVGAVPAALCPASSAADAWVVRATPSMHRVGRTRRGGVRCGFEPRFVECRTAWDRVCQRCSAVLAARRAATGNLKNGWAALCGPIYSGLHDLQGACLRAFTQG